MKTLLFHNLNLLVGEILKTYLGFFIMPLLVWVMIYFIIRPPKHGGKWIRMILIGILALMAVPFLLLGFAFGGIRGVIGVIIELLFASGIGIFGLSAFLVWRLAEPIGAIFDGGNEPPEAAPFYYIANLCRKQGKYEEAVARVEQQLRKFPKDLTGQMLLAEIQAEDLHDPSAAQSTVEHLIHQNCHSPEEVARALHRLADWHLQIGQDKASAQTALMRIIELFPNSELARLAYERLSHLNE